MCRSTDYHGVRFNDSHQRHRLKIRDFSVRFSGLRATKPLPESLTLLYHLPALADDDNEGRRAALEVRGSKVRPRCRAFVSLHREEEGDQVVFASGEPVRAADGVRFDVYLRAERVLKGILRKDEGSEWNSIISDAWVLDCKCALESDVAGLNASAAEVRVAAEGDVDITRRVSMVVKRRRNHVASALEGIPEETELDVVESDGCDCSCSRGDRLCPEIEFDGADSQEGCGDHDVETELDLDMEGVRWAVDVGIWVMCLGVGLLVSKASAKTLSRIRLL